jgi:hypothetical protein
LTNVFFADGVARGQVAFYPNKQNRTFGKALLAPRLGLRPEDAPPKGSMLSLSLDKEVLKASLRYHKPWRSLTLMADFMGLPLAAFVTSAGQSLYAQGQEQGTLAIATIDEPKGTQKALMRMKRNGALSGDTPPYELLSQPDWSLQTRNNKLEIRQGKAPTLPHFVTCPGMGLWARLDSGGIDKVASLLNLNRHPVAQHILPWTSGLEVTLGNKPSGSYEGTFIVRHKLHLADFLAKGQDPVEEFLGGKGAKDNGLAKNMGF